MRYESRPAAPPDLRTLRPHVRAALLAARRAWYAANPWRPIDWEAVARQQKGASDAMREAQRTQNQGELEAKRRAAQTNTLRRVAA